MKTSNLLRFSTRPNSIWRNWLASKTLNRFALSLVCLNAVNLLLVASIYTLIGGAVAVQAQEMDMHMHGGATNVGRVTFPVSCTATSRRQFGTAVALLHSFWYEEAESAFKTIARKDPRCAMAYWGEAMSVYHPLWEQPSAQTLQAGWKTIEQAKALGTKSERERDYIAAIETFYKDYETVDHVTRVLAYERAMERLHSTYPTDEEAAVFYSLSLIASAQALPADKSYAREKKAAAILNVVLQQQPNHPGVAHYLIHAYDSPPLANLALAAARSYAKIAPAVPHALHMPSHIFTRLGLWQESIKSNRDSEKAAKDYAVKMRMGGAWDQQLHAMDYLMYAYLQLAEDEKAKELLNELSLITKVTPEGVGSAYAFVAIPARYALERRQWSEAASLEPRRLEFPWSRYPWAAAIIHFGRGMGAARNGDAVSARNETERLAEIESRFRNATGYNWASQVEVQRESVAAWAAHAEGKNEEALKLMRSAADLEDSSDKHPVTPGPIIPARELLGELLTELGQPAAALKEFEVSLRAAPKRFNGLYGAARAAELAGEGDKASAYYQQLVALGSLSGGTGSNRPELEQARAFLRKRAAVIDK